MAWSYCLSLSHLTTDDKHKHKRKCQQNPRDTKKIINQKSVTQTFPQVKKIKKVWYLSNSGLVHMVVDDMIGSDISKQLEPDLKNKQKVEYQVYWLHYYLGR